MDVTIRSDRINDIEYTKVGNTFAVVSLLGHIDSGSVSFEIESDSSGTTQTRTLSISGSGTKLSLPEFGVLGFLQILLLIALVVSYSFHLS